MEIFFCKFMDCRSCVNPSEKKPSSATQWKDGTRNCHEAATNVKENIKCDSADITSEHVDPVDNGDGTLS
jgi:hypothetical protein